MTEANVFFRTSGKSVETLVCME